MKKTIVTLAVATIMAGTILSGCMSPAKKVENAENNLQDAKENVSDAQQDLNNAKQDSLAEYQKFKKEAEEKIIAHEKIMSDFKARIAKEKKGNKAIYEKKLAELEKKNSEMKKKLEENKETGKDKWESFKTKFNKDMDELGKAINNIFTE